MKSPIQQFVRKPDGTVGVQDAPRLKVIGQQMSARPAWEAALKMPTYQDEWDVMARMTGLSRHRLRFVLADESMTRIPEQGRLQPRRIVCPEFCYLELAHCGLCIGTASSFSLVEAMPGVEGCALIGEAVLFESELAKRALQGISRQIFTHACTVILTPDGEPLGTGHLVEVTLTTVEAAGCVNAKILEIWEA